jgi:O-antigen/teichoic acid export membrane protein
MNKIFKSDFLKGSAVMVIGLNLYNAGQFLYHLISGRLLGKVFYGDLATIITLLGIISVFQMAASLTIVRFIASEKDQKETDNFIKWVFRWSVIVGGILCLLTLLLGPILSGFLNLNQPAAVYLLGPILAIFFLANSNRSILQGLLKFDRYILSLLVESVFKISLTIALVLAGFAVFGAMVAFLIGSVASLLVTWVAISKHLKNTDKYRPDIKKLLKYSYATLAQGLAITSMYSVDLILVKHFLPSDQAGIYASLAILGRIVFFGVSPITNVMFPMVAKKHNVGEKYLHIFYLSLLIVVVISILVTSIYYLFPTLAIGILFGKEFLSGSPLLWLFGLSMSLLGLAMLFTHFYLSIGKMIPVIAFVLAAILQVVLIWFNHSDLFTVVKMTIISASLLDICLFVYFPYAIRQKKI